LGARLSAPVQNGPGAHPASCTMRTGSYPGVKSGPGHDDIPLLPLWAVRPVHSLSACTVELYLYSPYGPYGLYRASVPVQYSCTSTPPMGRTACTVQLYLYFPYGPYGLYRASVPVQYSYTPTPPMGCTACTEPQCLYSRAIPLLPLWAVRPVQSLSACTVELYHYSPYGPYGLYRASVPVQGRTLPYFIYGI